MKKPFRLGLTHGIPIGLGYLSVSFAFGIQAAGLGLNTLQATLISLTNLTSAGQLAGLPILAANGSLLEAALTQFIINLRYSLMSLSLTQRLDKSWTTLNRVLLSYGNTDEIFAVASGQPGKISTSYWRGLMLLPVLGWTTGTFLGAVAGQILPEFVQNALGIAIYGMFMAIILPPFRKEKPVRAVVLLAVAMSLCFRFIPLLSQVSGGFVIIICAVTASAVGAMLFPVRETEDSQTQTEKEVEA